MKRLTIKKIVTALVILLSGAAMSALLWIAATTSGARYFFATISSWDAISISAQKVEGRIVDHLLLTGVRVGRSGLEAEVDTLELRWNPLLLLAGKVAVQELTLNGVRIQDHTPRAKNQSVSTWPRVAESSKRLTAEIAQLEVKNLVYRRLQEAPVLVTSLAGSVTWQGGVFSARALKVVTPSGQLNGTLAADFNQPSLIADLSMILVQPIAGMDQFTVQIRRSSAGSEPFIGTVAVTGRAGSRKLLELNGEVGIEDRAFTLRQLRLTRPGQKGLITVDGTLQSSGPEPVFSLQVKVENFDLAPEINLSTDLSGTIDFAGTLENYQGILTLTNQGQGGQTASLSATYQGSRSGMNLALMNSMIFDGAVSGSLEIDWHERLAVLAEIRGKNINPARIHPDWKGVANFTATGHLAQDDNGGLSGKISAALQESRLHGQELTGELQAGMTGNNLTLNRLVLQGRGFDLQAAGDLSQQLTFTAKISDFSRLMPDANGTLQAGGWVRWRDGRMSGVVTGTGSRLAYAGTQIASANLTASFEQGDGYPLHLNATLRDLLHAGYSLQEVKIVADGTLEHHTAGVMIRSAGSNAVMDLAAGYHAGLWKGEIIRLNGRDSNGPWQLAAPATFTISAGNVSLSPLVLTAGAAERLEVTIDLILNPLNGQIGAKFNAIDLSRLNSWLPDDRRVAGLMSGRMEGIVLAEQDFAVDGNVVLSAAKLQQRRPEAKLDLTIPAATASWRWRGEELIGNLSLTMAEFGEVKADFRLPLPARFPIAIDPQRPLRGTLTAQLKEKGIITALFPELVQESFGALDAELTLGGGWDVPVIEGKVRLARAGAYLPTVGLHLKDVELAARLEKNLVRIDSFRASSGSGHIEGTALITLAGWQVVSYQGELRGENFQTIYHPELQIYCTPKLSFAGTPEKFTLRGDLLIPELQFVSALSHTAIEPSSDVIRAGRTVPETISSPLALDIQIRILLGEQVHVEVAGIDAQLGGAVELSLNRLDRITSSGEVKVIKGRYRTYGVNLDIVRGSLYFAGDTIDRPSLDFLALRTIGEVKAGVTVAGTLQQPLTELYSEPSMPDVDILAYIVLGHPLDSNGEQVDIIARAASVMLTSRQGELLREQLKNRFGLSTLEIQGGVGSTSGFMGYKSLSANSPGAPSTDQQVGITETMLTVGKYLTPKLYISYGRSLLTGNDLFRLRYDLHKKWQIESESGSESGVDLFYKLDFN